MASEDCLAFKGVAVGETVLNSNYTDSEAIPYLNSDDDQLRFTIGTFGPGKYCKLAGDIYLNDVDAID